MKTCYSLSCLCLFQITTPDTNVPSSASIDLPPIHVHADVRTQVTDTLSADGLTEGLIVREGNYLNAVAEVGCFEHSLTTDLLNHLVFVQKVFMKVRYGISVIITFFAILWLIVWEGNYLNAVAEVGCFEHSLTTDLLNHLVFVQKVFMKVRYGILIIITFFAILWRSPARL